jgi:hypothetical protein
VSESLGLLYHTDKTTQTFLIVPVLLGDSISIVSVVLVVDSCALVARQCQRPTEAAARMLDTDSLLSWSASMTLSGMAETASIANGTSMDGRSKDKLLLLWFMARI